MPTKFRSLGSILPAFGRESNNGVSGDGQPSFIPTEVVHSPNGSDHDSPVAEPRPSGVPDITVELPTDDEEAAGLHEYAKNADFWFNMQLSALEKYAVAQAGLHAQAGLPRQDVQPVEELPVETTLRARSVEIFLGWAARARRKVQDGIQASSVSAGDGLGQLRHTLAQLELNSHDIGRMDSKLREYESGISGGQRILEYGHLLGRWWYYGLITMLVCVDWVANVPVFSELLPREPGSEQRWQDIVATSERYGSFAGLTRLWDRILFAPDVSLLALGVIVFLMVLCHFCGSSLRRLVAFRPKDDPSVAIGLELHRRQAWLPFCAGALGILLVLSFLFTSRSQIEPQANARLLDANRQVQLLEGERAEASSHGQFDKETTLEGQLESARTVVEERSKALAYASGISAMNFPILLLNITLVLTACASAYLESNAKIVETRLSDPRITELEDKIRALRLESISHNLRLRTLDSQIEANIANAKYLSLEPPLRDKEAKANRLCAVIPLFRSENARQRGIDVQNILGFRQLRPLEFPVTKDDEPLSLPSEFASWELEFQRLRTQIARFQSTHELIPK
jgi:hypothetical protein